MPLQRSSVHASRLLLVLILGAMLPATMPVTVFKEIVKDRFAAGSESVAFFTSIAMFGSFLFAPVAGFVSDYFHNRRSFIAVFAAINGLMFFAMAMADSLALLFVLRFIEGATSVFVIGLLMSAVADRERNSEEHGFRPGTLMGLAGMLLVLGAFAGIPLGGVLGRTNALLPLYVSGTLMLGNACLAFFLKDTEFFHEERALRPRDALRLLAMAPLVLVPLLFAFTDRFTFGFLVSSFNLHLREGLHLNPAAAGLSMGVVMLPMVLLAYPSVLLGRRLGLLPLLLGGSALYGLALAAAGTQSSTQGLFGLLGLAGLGAGLMYIPSLLLAARLAPPGWNATVMSMFTAAGSLGFLLGPLASAGLEHLYRLRLEPPLVIPLLASSFGLLEVLAVAATIPFYRALQRAVHSRDASFSVNPHPTATAPP